jgi:type I restriction enzyme S subunit
MNDWPSKPLKDLCDPNRAIAYGIVQPGKPFPGGIPIVRVNNFGASGLNLSEVLSVDPDIERQYARSRPQPSDVLVTLVGSIGQVAIAPAGIAGWNLARAVGLLPMPDHHHAQWVAYSIRNRAAQEFIRQHANTTVQATFNLGDLAKLPIPYPDEPVRQDILETLTAIDDRIELNRRMNEALEGMAQAIFRDWFVDFGPTRRKAAGEADPVAIIGGLTPDPARAAHLAALFPAAFGNDGLPVGWTAGTLDRLVLVNSESWKTRSHPAQVEYVDLSNTKWGTIESTATLAWEKAPSRARRIARKGDTIVGTVRPGNGSYAYIGRDGYTVSTGFAVLRPKQAIYTDAIYVAATSPENISRLANLADGHGGAYPAVNPDAVGATPFPVVPDPLLAEFAAFAAPVREKIEQAKRENITLAETRDYLLPRLMSGAVRVVPKAEAA